MKKTIRTIIIATTIAIIIMISCAFALPACAEDHGEFYPKITIVFKTEKVGDMWVVYCQDKNGNVWAFYDDEEEWNVGDIANLLMWSIGEHEEDDEIVEVYLEGCTENINSFFQLIEWRQ